MTFHRVFLLLFKFSWNWLDAPLHVVAVLNYQVWKVSKTIRPKQINAMATIKMSLLTAVPATTPCDSFVLLLSVLLIIFHMLDLSICTTDWNLSVSLSSQKHNMKISRVKVLLCQNSDIYSLKSSARNFVRTRVNILGMSQQQELWKENPAGIHNSFHPLTCKKTPSDC